jgi:hypothetical protein
MFKTSDHVYLVSESYLFAKRETIKTDLDLLRPVLDNLRSCQAGSAIEQTSAERILENSTIVDVTDS